MSVILSHYPDNVTLPLPVENGVEFGFLPLGIPEPFGNKPRLFFAFDDNTFAPDGTEFTLLGFKFTVDSSTFYTHNTFNATINTGFAKAFAFHEMLKASFYFRECEVYMYSDGAFIVRVTCPDIGVYDGLGAWGVNFDNFDTPPFVVVEPGTDSGFPAGYRVIYQLLQETEEDVFKPVFEVQKAQPPVKAGTDIVLPTVVDFSHHLSKLVKTTIPEIDQNDFYDNTISKRFRVGYGAVKDGEGCNVEFARWTTSSPYTCFDAGFQNDDFVKIDRHVYQASNGYKIEFLTTMPQKHCLCRSNYLWLWCHVRNVRGTVGSEHDYKAKFTFFRGGTILSVATKNVGERGKSGFLVIGAGPANGLVEFPEDATMYCVELLQGDTVTEEERLRPQFARQTTPSASFATEPHYFKLSSGDCCDFDIYFQNHKGGYDLMTGLNRVALDIETSVNEICRDLPAGGSVRTEDFGMLTNGKFQVGGETFEKIVLETRDYQKTPAHLQMMRSFKASESRYVIRTNPDGTKYRRRILIESGTARIIERNAKIKVSFTAFWGDDFIHQST